MFPGGKNGGILIDDARKMQKQTLPISQFCFKEIQVLVDWENEIMY